MQQEVAMWSRNWAMYDMAHSGGRIAEGLSDEELVEYLRWMACNRPQRYAYLMTAVIERRIAMEKAIMGIGA
jgi:hypothetical protein